MILITGATGLTGSHLALHLIRQGKPVCAIFRDPHTRNKTKALFNLYGDGALFSHLEWREADLNDIPALETAFQGVTHVYHCAALISFNTADENQLRKCNIEGTANIVNCCLSFGVEKLCHVSSVAALGDAAAGKMVDENTEWNPEFPHHDYAISKYGAEMEVWRGYQEGLPVVIVNPGVIIGPGFWHSGSGEIFSRVAKGLAFYTYGVTGYVGVRDVVAVMQKLMESDVSGERFTLVSENLSYKQALDLVADSLKVKRPDIYARRWITSLAWKMDKFISMFGKKRTLSKDAAASLHRVTLFDNSKIKQKLGYTFAPMAEVTKETARYIAHRRRFFYSPRDRARSIGCFLQTAGCQYDISRTRSGRD
jgi:nucleoside-diphosphate-sugar epimerase